MNTREQFETVMQECRTLFSKKLHDYGAAWRIMRPESVTDQIYIKANRIRSIEQKGVSMVGEGIRPEFIGIVNYAICGGSSVADSCFHLYCHKYITSRII